MPEKLQRIGALARLTILESIRRHAILGLILLSLGAQAGGLLFFPFIPRDVGRASSDFIFSVAWLSGFIYLFFHAAQVIAWDEERRTIYALLARPITRSEYVLGIFAGLAILLLLLNVLLGGLGWATLLFIKGSVHPVYFKDLSLSYYLLSWLGLFAMEIMVLAVILFFSGLVRGGFPVLLISLAFYAICSGLPVVREATGQVAATAGESALLPKLLLGMTFLFPDFSRLDFKNGVVAAEPLPDMLSLGSVFGLAVVYVFLVMWLACFVYQRRDLQ